MNLLSIKFTCEAFSVENSVSSADLIAILSILVTVLIGWQIYNAIELNKKVEKVKNEFIQLKGFYDTLSKRCDNLSQDIQETKKNISKEIDDKIQKEKDKCILKDLFQISLENMYSENYTISFKGFCSIACMAKDLDEISFRDKSIDWAISLLEGHKENIKSSITRNSYNSILNKLKYIQTNEAKELVKSIEEIINSSLQATD